MEKFPVCTTPATFRRRLGDELVKAASGAAIRRVDVTGM
jgi:hypothetical protein